MSVRLLSLGCGGACHALHLNFRDGICLEGVSLHLFYDFFKINSSAGIARLKQLPTTVTAVYHDK